MYEDYIQNTFGMQMPYGWGEFNNRQVSPQVDLDSEYPEIYNIVYPMVRKKCSQNYKPLTTETIDDMAQDIYNNIEVENRNEGEEQENRQKSRGPIFDLVKILLIRELIDRIPGYGPRPPRPPRPPMPPRPPRPCDYGGCQRFGEWGTQMF